MTKEESNKMKGFAVILLIIHHFYASANRIPEGVSVNFWPLTQDLTVSILSTFRFCVGLFLIISGYGMYKSYTKCQDNGVYIYHRLKSIYYPFWFCWLIGLCVVITTGEFASKFLADGYFRALAYLLLDFLGFSNQFGTPTVLATYWYIGMIVQVILVFPILYACLEKKPYLTAIVVLLMGILAPTGSGNNNMTAWLSIFVMGMLMAKYECLNKITFTGLGKCVLFVLPVVCVGMYGITAIPYAVRQLFNSLVWFLWGYTFVIKLPVCDKVLLKLGMVSNFIFLTHNILLRLIPALTVVFYSFESAWLNVLVFLGAAYICAILVDKLFRFVESHVLFKLFNIVKKVSY